MALDIKVALKKPWVKYTLIGVAVIGAILIIKSRMSSAAPVQTGTTDGLSDAQAADLTQLQGQQNQIAAQAAQTTAQANAQQSAQDSQLALLQEQDKTTLAATTLNDGTSLSALNAQLDNTLAMGNLQLQGLNDQLQAATTQQLNQENSITQQQQNSLAAQININNSDNLVQEQANALNSITATTLASDNAQVQTTISNNNTAVNLSGIAANVNVANTASNNNVAIAQINSGTTKAVSSDQTSASKTSSWAGAAAGIALALFSDSRLKENIKRVGITDNGLPIYIYNYIGDPVARMGVMAQEAQKIAPQSVVETASGYLAVDYSKIN